MLVQNNILHYSRPLFLLNSEVYFCLYIFIMKKMHSVGKFLPGWPSSLLFVTLWLEETHHFIVSAVMCEGDSLSALANTRCLKKKSTHQ